MSKIFKYFSYMVLALTFGCILIVSFWLSYPYKTSTPNIQPYAIITKTVKPGGTLIYKPDWCRFTDIPARTTRSFADTLVFSMETQINQSAMGCHNDNVALTIPPNLPPGIYRLKMIYEYKVNPIRTITKIAETEQFEVK